MNRRRLKERVAVLEAELLKHGIVVCSEGHWYLIDTGNGFGKVAYFDKELFHTVDLDAKYTGEFKYVFNKVKPTALKGCIPADHLEVVKYFNTIFQVMGLKLNCTIASKHDTMVVAKYKGYEGQTIKVSGPKIYYEGYLIVDAINPSVSRVVVPKQEFIALGDWIKLTGESKGFCKILEHELVSIVNKDPGVEELVRGCKIYKKGTPEWKHLEEFYQNA